MSRRHRSPEPARLFAVACPGCEAEVAVKASRAGSAARCPACRGLFLVPEPRLEAPPTRVNPAVEPAAARPAPLPAEEPLPALAPPPPPPGAAATAAAEVSTPFDEIELPAAAGSPELALQEPVRTVESEGRVIELRRISDDERRRRKTRRTIVTLLVGSAILATLVWVLGRRPG